MQHDLGELYQANSAQLLELCRRLLDEQDAREALHDTFLSVAGDLKTFRGEASLRTWLFRIALRTCLKRGSMNSRNAGDEPLAGLVDPRTQPDDQASSRQEAERVQAAMMTLSAEHRAVLTLFSIDGLGHGEIAEVLGIPEGTVWSRLHTARKRLIERLPR